VLAWGNFVSTVINFVILAFVIFLLVKQANKLMRKGPDAPAGPSEVDLLAEIRDELRKRP
jgi:large conductance mechanosensitive channel